MMSGDENNNDKHIVENSEKDAQVEQQETEKRLLSEASDDKSYPFSLPEDDDPEGNQSAPQTNEPDADDVIGALSDDTREPDAQSLPDVKIDASQDQPTPDDDTPDSVREDFAASLETENYQSDAVDEEIEASLDEGLFANEVLPEESPDDVEVPQDTNTHVQSDSTVASADSHIEVEQENFEESSELSEGMEPSERDQREPDIGAIRPTSAQTDYASQAPHSETPKHAFDMGEPEMTEKEYSESVKKKSGFGTILASIIIFFLLVGVVIGGGFFYVKLKFNAPGAQPQALSHVIKPKQGLRVIAEDLEKKGIIQDKNIFMLGTYINGANKSLKAGEFEFAPNASMSDVLETISKGKVIQHKITLAEGLTSQQIVEIINDNPVLTGDIEQLPAEGSLLPETYQFERGMTRQQIIGRMQKAQKDLIDKLWPGRDDNLGVVTPADAIILASIVEKETGLSAERARVAAVFNNRMLKNMRLQSDPTVIYGIVGGEGKLDRPIRRSDLDESTPYNTYKINGLPPTPIANPGRASIEAVLKPARTNDLYFVADGTGGHAFATTLKEHNENVARWRKLEKGVDSPALSPAEEVKSSAEKASAKVKDTVKATSQKSGVLEKTTTLKTDLKSAAEKPEKSDFVAPIKKPTPKLPDVQKEVVEKKESISEKVKTIFVKPEEAPLPRSKPNSLVKEGLDKINVSPLPVQKVPQAPQVNSPQVPQISTPQAVQPGAEPTPELETLKPAPKKEKFNPFDL